MRRIYKAIMAVTLCAAGTAPVMADAINAYQEGAVWEYEGMLDSDPGVSFESKCYFDGIMTMDDKEYLQLYEEVKIHAAGFQDSKDYVGALRCDNGKVFYLPEGCSKEYLLFDFNMQVGDEVTVYPGDWGGYKQHKEPTPYIVKCTARHMGTTLAGEYEMMETTTVMDGMPEVNEWIVGIGSTISPITNIYATLGGLSGELVKVTVGDDVVYKIATSGIDNAVDDAGLKESGKCYNMDGTIHKPGQKGLYIDEQGRKTISR